jgi:pyridoxamine 5'-phosphate oxidase
LWDKVSECASLCHLVRFARIMSSAPGDTLGEDPVAIFTAWYDDAVRSGAPFADAMTLATATPDGQPSARIVLYKGISGGGLFFVSNYESQKARELADNPEAALVFFWAALGRQVRIAGRVERASDEESDGYFRSRARESQLGAWVSAQSRPLSSRAELEASFREIEQRFAGQPVERPAFWGGYRLVPRMFEFWLSREHRLHDRFRYERAADGWRCERLSP